eukprot:s7039_g2.t1
MVCRYLAALIRKVDPCLEFGALQVLVNVQSGFHLDKSNAKGSRNLIAPLTRFDNGQVWVRDEKGTAGYEHKGSTILGRLCDVSSGPMPAFADRLSIADRSSLSELGFVFRNINADALAPLRDIRQSKPEKPQVAPLNQVPLLIELCAGHAVLSTTAEGQSLPIDHNLSRAPGRRLLRLDLADADNIDYLLELIQAERRRVALIFISLPSGTASVHRGKHIGKWARQGYQQPSWKGQPFFLRALACTAEVLEDPDWQILIEGTDCYVTGVPVGFEEELPRVPQVFELKTKSRKLDESDPEHDRKNYPSAEISAEELRAKFREEELAGRMQPTTLGALKSDYPESRIRIASMGAIVKPDGSVRPIHDGTHGVGVNNGIALTNHMSVPGPGEMAFAVRQSAVMCEPPLAVSADVKAAHRLLLHRKSDWALLACRASSEDDVVWINKVPVELPAATDNKSNQHLMKKQSTTKWPLMLVNMQFSHLLREACLRVALRWKHRAENDLADQLTNERFDSFSPDLRVQFSFDEVPLDLLNQLWETKTQFDLERKHLASMPPAAPSKRKADKSPW